MVSIANVYNRVLYIFNKEARGYITRDEFNSLAIQAQLEIFESYFAKHAASIAGANDTTYSDPLENISEKIHFFSQTATLPDTDEDGFFIYPDRFYRLGVVRVLRPGKLPVIADEVSHNDITYINLSPLTAPTVDQPVFTRRTRTISGVMRQGLEVYPNTMPGSYDIEIDYLRTPIDPVLYGTIVDSQFIVDPGSIDFELHPSEEIELTTKILAYAGVIVRDPEVLQVASQKDQQITAIEQ